MNPSRSRRTLLAAAAAFVLTQAALAVAVMTHPVLSRDDLWQRKVRRYHHRLAGQPDALVVAQLGSSRTESGVRGVAAEPWLCERLGRPVVLFNMGSRGAGPAANLVNLRRMLNDGVRPHLLLVEVLPPLLTEDELLEDLAADRLPASQLRHDEAALTASLGRRERPWLWAEWLRDQSVPAATHRQPLLSVSQPRLLTADARRDGFRSADESGYVPPAEDALAKRAQATEAARRRYQPALATFRLSPRRLDLVGETVEAARREGMGVALVLMPEGPTFRSWYPPGTWPTIREAVEAVARRHGVPLLDLREALDEDDTFDSHHATEDGASKLTRTLAGRVEPLLRGRR